MAKIKNLKIHIDGENVYLAIEDFCRLIDMINGASEDFKRLQKQIEEYEIYKDAFYNILEIVDDTYLKTVEVEMEEIKSLA